jgi:nitrate reductase assembly molybdenum cofactor insertion protein NarJ
MIRILLIPLLLNCLAAAPATRPFIHPGLLHTKPDLDRMRTKVAANEAPWKAGFDALTPAATQPARSK